MQNYMHPYAHGSVNIEVASKKGKYIHSVPRHVLKHHDKATKGLHVWVIEAIQRDLPGAEKFKRLYQRDIYWIYILDVLSPDLKNLISTIL